jgi:hypothetical protein
MQLSVFLIKRLIRRDETGLGGAGCDLRPHLTFQWAGVILFLRRYYLHV